MHVLSLRAPAGACGALVELLSGIEAPSSLVQDVQQGTPGVLCFYCESETELATVRAAVETTLGAAHDALGLPPVAIEAGVLRKEEWADAWKRFFHVQRVGKRLVIRPSWEEYAAQPGDVVITLDPGMAFGTGQHATTRACLAMLEEIIDSGVPHSMLDAGTGSGVLSIAAALMGVGKIDAFDIEKEAVMTARDNAEINRVAGAITFFQADLDAFVPGRAYDIIAANMIDTLLMRNAAKLARAVAPGGSLLISGILGHEYESVAAAFSARGLAERTVAAVAEWRTGWFAKPH